MLPRNLLWLDFLREQFQKDPSLAVPSSRRCCQCQCTVGEKFHTPSFLWETLIQISLEINFVPGYILTAIAVTASYLLGFIFGPEKRKKLR